MTSSAITLSCTRYEPTFIEGNEGKKYIDVMPEIIKNNKRYYTTFKCGCSETSYFRTKADYSQHIKSKKHIKWVERFGDLDNEINIKKAENEIRKNYELKLRSEQLKYKKLTETLNKLTNLLNQKNKIIESYKIKFDKMNDILNSSETIEEQHVTEENEE